MVASKHVPAAGHREIERLVTHASELDFRAPEVAMVLGERAAALAESAGSGELWVLAESVVVSARVRLGHRASTVGRAVTAMRAAEDAGYSGLVAQVRTDLAICARSVGAPLIGLAALRPVLAGADLPAVRRAAALCHLVGCLSQFGRKPELDRALVEADRLCSSDDELDGDERLLARALIRVAVSSHRRRHADLVGAADAARTGLGFIEQLDDREADGGVISIRLLLQLVCSLFDRGETEIALEIAQPVLAQPERAASIAPAGWLRLAIATRVLLPTGAGEAATRLLREAVHSTERHGLHALTSRLWLELADVEERLGRPLEAVECLHKARAAEHVHARARKQAYGLLSGEFGAGAQASVDLDEVLAPAPRQSAQPVVRDPEPVVKQSAPEFPPASLPAAVKAPVPELRLAPEPAVESTPRVSPIREPEPPRVAETAPRERARPAPEPVAAAKEAEENRTREEQPVSSAKSTTRHDSEHGSVAARSVLDRLGISARGGGGRRRASDQEAPAEPEKTRSGEMPPPEPEPVVDRGPERFDPSTEYSAYRPEPVNDPWLPRLKLPPSLAPLDELTSSAEPDWGAKSTSEPNGFSEPFLTEPPGPLLGDEPPPDAGLAELLARALAEHQAGTSSAAALVKKLGSQGAGDPRPVNGHGRNGDSPDNGRHRTD